ncbi:EamA family transporter [Roseisolibacter sp. H3M3-2]|uniref:EamA family transporter n=1 Tax=Roseisolibacter sp. H3M3-2 TaxID=3031323 RepID=UPI0023DCB6A7|nr:EamA family transporter [Roseisolibacter sp. H3M3-2]MDF1503938.1 EamA family transporter [Roseisolibacter sp. H3M3-2]
MLAFAIVYVVWGSTYLAMRIAVRTVPPFLLGAMRFLVAGALLGAWVAWRERPGWPGARAWGWATVTGALLFLGGNAGVAWAGRTVPSGVVALLAASLALWMVLIDWLRPHGRRPSAPTVAGLALGLAGVGLLVGPAELAGSGGVDPWGSAFVLAGSFAWAVGSMLTRHPAAPASPIVGSAMQMVAGGLLLAVVALLHGDVGGATAAALAPGAPGARAGWASLAYLIVFGSLIGFTAYIWLMRHAAPSKVATYAYVNPVVAVLLGWALGGEGLEPRVLTASAVIVAAVALITVGRTRAA